MSFSRIIIVGSGLFGLTIAEQIVSSFGIPVDVIEKRAHFGGNAYSEIDPTTGIEIHKYGSHLFHTSSDEVWKYVNRFSSFTNYQHTVWTRYGNQLYSLPINLATINSFFGKSFSPSEAKLLIQEQALEITNSPSNLEEKAISSIGRPLYEAFIKGYTQKQWQTDPRNLDSAIISRLPVRFNLSNHYFDDTYQGLPKDGYFTLLNNMISNPLINVFLNTDFFDIRHSIPEKTLCIYTGPLDQYFDYVHGPLKWRTLDFSFETLDIPDFQGASVINYSDPEIPYTRIHEFKHLHPERKTLSERTIIAREYSRFAQSKVDEPYYPVNSGEDRARLALYRKSALNLENVIFGGRLGTYQYLDMHMAIASAFSIFRNEIVPWVNRNCN